MTVFPKSRLFPQPANGCARKIRATTYAAIFPRCTSCTPSALNGDHCGVIEQPVEHLQSAPGRRQRPDPTTRWAHGHPSSCRLRRTDRVVGLGPKRRHSPPGSGGVTPKLRCRRCERVAEPKVRIRSLQRRVRGSHRPGRCRSRTVAFARRALLGWRRRRQRSASPLFSPASSCWGKSGSATANGLAC